MKLGGYEDIIFQLLQEVTGYLIKIGAEVEDAKDVTQETVVKMLEVEAVIPPEKIRPWFYRVALNLYFNLYRQTKRRREILQLHFNEEFYSEMPLPNEELETALNQLDLASANLLILKYHEGLSLQEMAFILNRPPESIKTALYRSRKKLRQLMEELG
ncbi:RNA polymerase sigma factor [Enterococcus sp. HY326]|uniref:RNA polymerase sigma factor n=1 Tax=Enterococcus sp. HY326 TaxID=2971265 RepID=UPI002240B580|nr:RNA polymerase sigma factor [Enterococcus sp. HY326]